MENIIINIGRQIGSGGRIIAKKLADEFNCTLYDRIKAAGITDEATVKSMAMLAHYTTARFLILLPRRVVSANSSSSKTMNAKAFSRVCSIFVHPLLVKVISMIILFLRKDYISSRVMLFVRQLKKVIAFLLVAQPTMCSVTSKNALTSSYQPT